MFQMFGFGGVKCQRCEHKNAGDAAYCEQCGMMLGAPRNEPVLRENRWIAGPNELAVFFGVRELDGLFTKTLHVPATTRAYILQGKDATEVPQGEYEIEGFFTRLNHLLRDQHAEILITRTTAVPVEFSFDDLHTAEHLPISARFSVSIKIERVSVFAHHFMTVPGTVTGDNLAELLAPSVRQLAADFIAAQSLRDMAANRELRLQFDERLQGALKQRLAQFGLAAEQVETLALRHDKFDANRARIGSLWLVVDEGHVQLEHTKQLDQLYTEQEWQQIWREEQDGRMRHRRAELHSNDNVSRAELTLQESERMQTLRMREVELYGRIVDAKSRKQAIERGAGEVLAELEHELAKKGAARDDETADWEHLRALAGIRMRTELEIAQQDARETFLLAQQRFSQQLLMQQIKSKVAQALLIEDEAHQRKELQRLRLAEDTLHQRQAELDAEQHRAAWQSLTMANAARERETQRMQEWEDQLALDRQRDLLRRDMIKDVSAKADAEDVAQRIEAMRRTGAKADAVAQYEKLMRTIEADTHASRQLQQVQKQTMLDQLEVDQQRHLLKQQEQEGQWQQELKRLEHEREEKFARWRSEQETLAAQQAHNLELARIEIARQESLGRLSDTAKLALAAAPNAAVLADYLKTQVHAGMSAGQLEALAGVVGSTNSVAPLDAMRMAEQRAQQERAARDAEMDKDRRHQLDLINLQNDVNKAALAAQSELGIGVAKASVPAPAAAPVARQCANGHPARPHDKFCAECGAPL